MKETCLLTGKRRYDQKVDALAKLAEFAAKSDDRKRVPKRTYYCGLCGGWHLTSYKKYRKPLPRKAAQREGLKLNRPQRKALQKYDPVQALHRAMRSHQWKIWKLSKGGIYQGERKRSWWFAELYCVCGVRKFFIKDSVGRPVGSPRYAYPEEYRLVDLGLDPWEISQALWVVVFEREMAEGTVSQLQEMQHERKAGRD